MMSSFEQELQKIGLSQKEAGVYLASLVLGPSSVQQLSERSKVNRATTYVMIESLTERGLMSSFVQGKKKFFRAESPEHLRHIVERETQKIKEKKEVVDAILPNLSEMINAATERPKISLFEGMSGLKEVQEDILVYGKKAGQIDSIVSVDDARKLVVYDSMIDHWGKMSKHKIKIRTIFTQTGSAEKVPASFSKLWQERRISEKNFLFHGEVAIYGDRVAFLTYRGKILGVIIESQEIAQTTRVLFELAWMQAQEK